MIINTKRFILRPIKISDANETYLNWFKDKVVKENIFYASKNNNIKRLRSYIKKKINKKNVLFFCIISTRTKHHIGNIKFEPLDIKKKQVEMGIMIGDSNWRGQGVANEVLIACQ